MPDQYQITKWLAKYKNAAATKKQILNVLKDYRSLTSDFQIFVFNDGIKKDLVNLSGTIPVEFKGNIYYIPICIWLMDTHPQHAPLCFVNPTSNMVIKPNMFVDFNGRIYLPYLHDWRPKTSDLISLIQVMIVTFGEYMPLYQKSNKSSIPPVPYQPNATGNPGTSSYLPYPPNSGQPTGNPVPYPPYPGGSPLMIYHGNPNGAAGSSTGPSNSFGNIPPYPGYNNYNPAQSTTSTGTITEQHLKDSLISAVKDKMRRRVQEKVNQYQAEIETLNRTKQELMESSSKIDGIIMRLKREENELQKNLSMLREKEKELEKNLESLENADSIDPDEAITTTAPLYKQLLHTYSEEAATEDAIYYLGEALRSGVIDLETFLKQVRQLSRKQFMLRALMQKCRQRAGLAG